MFLSFCVLDDFFRFSTKLGFGYFWSTLLWYQCYYPHRSRDALYPICKIFFSQNLKYRTRGRNFGKTVSWGLQKIYITLLTAINSQCFLRKFWNSWGTSQSFDAKKKGITHSHKLMYCCNSWSKQLNWSGNSYQLCWIEISRWVEQNSLWV